MFAFFQKVASLFHFLFESQERLVVDYGAPLYAPRGTKGVRVHKPLGLGQMELEFSRIKLEKIPFGMTAAEYKAAMPKDTRFCDAKVLDALTLNNVKVNRDTNPKKTRKLIARLGTGTGPIYFLGTLFEDARGRELVGVLDRSPEASAFRFVVPAQEPITCLGLPFLADTLQFLHGKTLAPSDNFAAVYID